MTIEERIIEKLLKAVAAAQLDTDMSSELSLAPSKQKSHGDLATNIALVIASREKKNPREIAERIVKHLDLGDIGVQDIDIAGPGFINFTFSLSYHLNKLNELLQSGTEYGQCESGGGKKTQVEFVSANPTGPLTIGHGRQAVIGDTIARLLEATGYNITREYYFNDAGRQMRVLGDSVRLRYLELLGESVTFPEDYYQGGYIGDIARQIKDEKHDQLRSETDVAYFQQKAESVIFQDIKDTVGRLGIQFDVFFNEKSLYESGEIEAIIQSLKNKDLAYDHEGAVWFRTTKFGMEQDRVIVKSSGEPTYRLPDIAYHKNKLDRGFELIIDIFGADHIATYPDVLAGIEALGYDKSKIQVLIHQFVTLMEGKEKIKMSTRKANFVTLDELIDEVGVDATRYFFLNRSMTSHLNFDLSLAKTQSDENPVYYVQYAHARVCSILQYAREQGYDPESEADLNLLKTEEEIALIKILLFFPKVIMDAAELFEPHRLPSYLEEVATVYHRFQHAGKRHDNLRVVTKNKTLTMARLALCRATRIVLANGLKLMGISAPEHM